MYISPRRQVEEKQTQLDYIPLMRYGFGTLRDNQRDMPWQDVTWRGMTWCDLTWRDMTWHDMDVTTCQDVSGRVRTVTWHDMTWRDMTMKLTIKYWSCDRHACFCAIAYKFIAFLSRNEYLGNCEKLLNRKVTSIFEVTQTCYFSRNVSKGSPDLKNINSEEISKINKTQSRTYLRVRLKPEVYLDFWGQLNMVTL